MATLDHPASPSALYLARGEDVERRRPVMTGDVFDAVAIPGVNDGEGLAMVLAHPCSMRRGAHLRSHLRLARVAEGSPIDPSAWDGNYGVMPLPDLVTSGDHTLRAVFDLSGRVDTETLAPKRRVACLDRPGILLALQRQAFDATRVVIDLPTLHESIVHVLEEADMLEEWLAARCDDATSEEELLRAIHAEEIEFDRFMGASAGSTSRRASLRNPAERPSVRRAMFAELQH